MGLMDRIRAELIDIIEWTDSSSDTIVYRFERHGNEIKNGAKLVVREGQVAVFVDEGQLADVFEPGTYTLETANLPVLSTLRGWKYGFESPFKAEVYFVNTKRFTDQKWGTKNPIMLRDPEFGPIRLRAFGTYAFKVNDAATFLREVVGTDGHVSTDEVTNQLRNIVVARFVDVLGESKLAALDLAANYDELGTFIQEKIEDDMGGYGVEILNLLVENISLPPAVEEALDKRSSMGVIGNLGAYTQFQTANAMEAAASNPSGGAAGAGVGFGAGMAMANQMGNAMAQPGGTFNPAQTGAPQATPPPPPPSGPTFHMAVDGQTTGPFDMNALKSKAQAGELTKDTNVWNESLGAWKPAGEVSDLDGVFAAVPPPPPPA